MKKPIFFITLLILSIGVVQIRRVSAERGTFAIYEVINSSNSMNFWYNADYSESYLYHIPIQSLIEINFTALPKETLDISVGNLTRIDTTDTVAGNNLILNYWALDTAFGFLANTSWGLIVEELKDIEGLEYSHSEIDYSLNDKVISANSFSFVSDGQNTTLIYETTTGLLVEGGTGFGLYFIHIKIQDTDFYLPEMTGNGISIPFQFNILYFILTIPLINRIKAKK